MGLKAKMKAERVEYVLDQFGYTVENLQILIRRQLVPRPDPGDYRIITEMFKAFQDAGLEDEWVKIHDETKRDFITLPIRYV